MTTPQIIVNVGTANPNVGSTTANPAIGAVLLDELVYLNIHSDGCPAGELRGQLLFPSNVPLSSFPTQAVLILLMLGVGLAAVVSPKARRA